ncbi:MAG TPA: acyl-CoA thioesterase II [Jatrophihabitans sp.]|nr:acyl-CoA thioesterase II [Jatrophihabitans sp.]
MADSVDTSAATGQQAVDDLVRLLDLDQVAPDVFEGRSPQVDWQRVFGGQVAGQALVAAGRTVPDDRPVHSLHSYFVRPGDPRIPIRYEVDRARDGRSFSIRRVVARQNDDTIFALAASFQLDQPGAEHQTPMPDVPDPESLPPISDHWTDAPHDAKFYKVMAKPIDLRHVELPPWQQRALGPREGPSRVWLRADGRLPDDPLLHVCVLTFCSDMTLLDAVMIRHGLSVSVDDLSVASLDHAMWFRQPFRADEWLLYSTESPSAAGSRGLASGRFYTRAGVQVASVVQEGMVRVRSRG